MAGCPPRPLGEVPELTESQWAWVAGIIEGEGCVTTIGHRTNARRLTVEMTDEDIINRLHEWTGVGTVRPKKARPFRNNSSKTYYWRVGAHHELRHILNHTFDWLGERRQARITELLPDLR